MRKVVVRTEVYLDEVSNERGYVMKGHKGDFILARDVEGKYIFVRVTPGKTTKPVHKYDTVLEAITAKMEAGYDVFEYDKAELS